MGSLKSSRTSEAILVRAPNWHEFTQQSDRRYRAALDAGGDLRMLAPHNVVSGGDAELRTVLSMAASLVSAYPSGRALDVCCGAGFMARHLADAGFDVTGIDINADAIALATAQNPDCRFLTGDAARPDQVFCTERFDFILIREAHPFSRIDDFDMQFSLLSGYLRILNPGGLIVLAHARRGGGMNTRSFNYVEANRRLRADGFQTAGPYFLSLIKRFGGNRPRRLRCALLSLLTQAIQKSLDLRLAEAFFIKKPFS